jgi:energy-coupling factor transporter transmembrane protein EcfT
MLAIACGLVAVFVFMAAASIPIHDLKRSLRFMGIGWALAALVLSASAITANCMIGFIDLPHCQIARSVE